ncbi:uncharacterized protein DMAD_05069 [Drosophila madeirensis]|uniref:Uncharacterized protein n=1 Tax=Drosophila madeirensis TaxID=30013 RepID=A0AAU9FL95_DROMD
MMTTTFMIKFIRLINLDTIIKVTQIKIPLIKVGNIKIETKTDLGKKVPAVPEVGVTIPLGIEIEKIGRSNWRV